MSGEGGEGFGGGGEGDSLEGKHQMDSNHKTHTLFGCHVRIILNEDL